MDAQLAILPHKPPPRPFGAQAHPIITLCVGLGICGGIYACYSGLLSRKHGKNVGVKNTPLPFYQERFNTMKRWLLLVASTLGFTSQETLSTEKKPVEKIEVKKESFLLNEILEEIYSNIQQITSGKNLEFSVDVEKNINVLLNTDKGKLEQILINLLVNAVKFTEKGFVKLGIKVINGTDIEFSVTDTGIGISDENKKII